MIIDFDDKNYSTLFISMWNKFIQNKQTPSESEIREFALEFQNSLKFEIRLKYYYEQVILNLLNEFNNKKVILLNEIEYELENVDDVLQIKQLTK